MPDQDIIAHNAPTPDGRGQPAPDLPPAELHQPDPFLQMSRGGMGAGWVTVVAIGIAVVLGVVFYGLNGPNTPATAPGAHGTAASGTTAPAPPAAPQTTGPASHG